MIRGKRAVLPALTCALFAACGGEHPAPPGPQTQPLGAGLAARVGAQEVPLSSVGRVAAAQRVDPSVARELVVRDALFAEEARTRGLDRAPEVVFATQALLARQVLRELLADAERAGPVSDAELALATERHWLDLDRPDAFRTVHAVAELKPDADDATRRRATEIIEAIARAVAPAREIAAHSEAPAPKGPDDPAVDPASDAFIRAAEAVPHEGLKLTVQKLGLASADGRQVSSAGGGVDLAYARAAAALSARGDSSPPVTSQFGVHVIMLLERVPGVSVAQEERRRLVHDEVMATRARAAQTALLEGKRQAVLIERGADALLAQVPIEP